MSNVKLVVEVLSASNLPPKDGEGSASPYVEVTFDSQRLRTKTKAKDLNPVWNEVLEFRVSDPDTLDEEYIEFLVFTERKGGHRHLLGRAKVEGQHIRRKGTEGAEEAMSFQLEKGWFIFTMAKGELFIKAYYFDEARVAKEKVLGRKKDKDKDLEEHRAIPSAMASVAEEKARFSSHEFRQSSSEHRRMEMSSSPWDQPPTASDFMVKATTPSRNVDVVQRHDLVPEMKYLFVRVERARGLAARDATGSSDPFVEVKVGNVKVETAVVPQNLNPVWKEVFAIAEDRFQADFLEITVWDYDTALRNDFLGFVALEIAEIPERRPPDSPLAPQWYRLESRNNKRAQGEIMLSVWIGTQADEAFPQARQSDSGWSAYTRSKIYMSPRLWYLRVIVHEAQDLIPTRENRHPEAIVKVDLGFQMQRTNMAAGRHFSLSWEEELLFVAAEPFNEEFLTVSVLDRMGANKDEVMGFIRIPMTMATKRTNLRPVDSKWFDLEREKKDLKEVAQDVADKIKGNSKFTSRIRLTLCLEGGYHVLDESTHYSSDMRPTDKRLWKEPVAILEVGLLGATGLVPMKTRDGRSCTDPYCVAKYGPKWVRTRTVMDSLAPQWNEQYHWDVYDPCTVLTVGVFDNHHLTNSPADKVHGHKDEIIGKVRIRLSTLETDREYSHRYPLIVLEKSGVKKKGELEMVVRLTCTKRLNMMQAYILPLLPKQHYLRPFHVRHVEALREAAMRIVIMRLARSEPPVRSEVVRYMLDVDAYRWSFRRSKANWSRISRVFSSCASVMQWFQDICNWKNPVTTVLVHILYFILVWYPELILPTFFLYMFLIGAWQYRFRPRHPPHMDVDLSLANASNSEELDEEFDPIPTSKPHEIVRARYDRLRALAGRIQTVIGDLATQLERFHALLNWRDPRATTIFILFCLVAAVILYVTPVRVIAIFIGVYVLRHPRFRDGMPPIPLNFFRRLPALSDRML